MESSAQKAMNDKPLIALCVAAFCSVLAFCLSAAGCAVDYYVGDGGCKADLSGYKCDAESKKCARRTFGTRARPRVLIPLPFLRWSELTKDPYVDVQKAAAGICSAAIVRCVSLICEMRGTSHVHSPLFIHPFYRRST
jgi:hypothetical protein